MAVTVRVCDLAAAGGDARQVDRLQPGVLEDRDGVGDRVERGGVVDRGDGDRAERRAEVVDHRAVVGRERHGAGQRRGLLLVLK